MLTDQLHRVLVGTDCAVRAKTVEDGLASPSGQPESRVSRQAQVSHVVDDAHSEAAAR